MSHTATPLHAPSTGLKILQPSNIIILLIFYSPILASIAILSWGVIMQNVKGFIYLLFMLAMSVVRGVRLRRIGKHRSSRRERYM